MIPFVDLRRSVADLFPELDGAALRVVRSGRFLRGEETAAWEAEWAAYTGHEYCVACSNGTDAVTLAAAAVGLRSAAVSAATCWLTGEGLSRAGVRVEVSDVDPDTALPLRVDGVASPLFGRPPLGAEAACRVVDAAQAAGWKPSAQVVAWSFYPTKPLGALGDAGAVTTGDPRVAARLRELAGADDAYRSPGQIVSRMDELQAALLRVKLPHLDRWNEERRAIARLYWAGLDPARARPVNAPAVGTHHLFPVLCSHRERVTAALTRAGVGHKVHYPVPLNRCPAAWAAGSPACPGAERWSGSVLSLPCFAGLTPAEVGAVCGVVNAS